MLQVPVVLSDGEKCDECGIYDGLHVRDCALSKLGEEIWVLAFAVQRRAGIGWISWLSSSRRPLNQNSRKVAMNAAMDAAMTATMNMRIDAA